MGSCEFFNLCCGDGLTDAEGVTSAQCAGGCFVQTAESCSDGLKSGIICFTFRAKRVIDSTGLRVFPQDRL